MKTATMPAGRPGSDPRTALRAQSLASGAIGDALLDIERAQAGAGSWRAAHAALSAVAAHPLAATGTASLFLGAPAVAFAMNAAARGTGRYAAALRVLDAQVAALTTRRLEQAGVRIGRGQRPANYEFDLLYGLTGLGAYLLHRDQDSQLGLLRDVLAYLVRLTLPLPGDGERLPGWWAAQPPPGRHPRDFPGGHGNLGMAHGISGPLALLALASGRAIEVIGQADAITRICQWLDSFRRDHAGGTWWPQWVTLAEHRCRAVTQPRPGRPSWCYGTPGQARAQQLAGITLGDHARQHLAEQALLSCVTDPAQLALITDASLCHGAAGLLHITSRAAADGPDGMFSAYLPALRDLLQCQPAPPCGGLLEGGTGTALVLLSETTGVQPASGWDICLLAGLPGGAMT